MLPRSAERGIVPLVRSLLGNGKNVSLAILFMFLRSLDVNV